MAGHAPLPCEVYIFIFDNASACSVSVVVECKHASGSRFNSWPGKNFI